MMQGDQYNIPFTIKIKSGTTVAALTPSDIADVEVVIGDTAKTYLGGGITYSDEKWYYAITQQETFALASLPQPAQVRVKFPTGDVIGAKSVDINVRESISKEVL